MQFASAQSFMGFNTYLDDKNANYLIVQFNN
jgi:hypothetical protein